MNIDPNWSKFAELLREEAAKTRGAGPGNAGSAAALVLYGIAKALEEAIPNPNEGLKPYR
jgi:hypothetical protein